jgi:Tfp pilus assembly protein PilO
MASSSRIKSLTSTKHLQIDKANTTMVITIAVASALLVFSLFAARALASQASYNKKVIAEKEKAVSQLEANIAALEQLDSSYQEFVQRPSNIIAGNSTGNGDRDGDNAKIVLDALPSKYDFPGLVSSLEKMFALKDYKIESIGGTDDEIAQQTTVANGTGVEIPIQLGVNSSYAATKDMLKSLELSIRPIKLETLTISGSDANVTTSVIAKTYYLPEKTINIETKVIK